MCGAKVKFENLIIGKRYFVNCGIWQGDVEYLGLKAKGKRMQPYFTFGTSETWQSSFGIHAAKSNLKIYELEKH